MSRNIHKIKKLTKFLENKTIAVVGNASSLLEQEYSDQIDKADIVIRMNRFSKVRAKIGTKTDVLALSLNLEEECILKMCQGEPEFLFYMSDKRDDLNNYLERHAVFYPDYDWNILNMVLGARPTTGCMVINFLYNFINFKSVDVYGFDFLKTPNVITGVKHKGSHDYKAEEKYIRTIAKSKKKKVTIYE
jgi:hypothetical protein